LGKKRGRTLVLSDEEGRKKREGVGIEGKWDIVRWDLGEGPGVLWEMKV